VLKGFTYFNRESGESYHELIKLLGGIAFIPILSILLTCGNSIIDRDYAS